MKEKEDITCSSKILESKIKMILLILIICLRQSQAEHIKSDEISNDLVYKNDFEEMKMAFAKMTTEFKEYRTTQAERTGDLEKKILELDDLKKDVVYLKALNQEILKHKKSSKVQYHSTQHSQFSEDQPVISMSKENPIKPMVMNQTTEEPNLEDRVEKLETFFKVRTLRSCEEYAQFGIRTSGVYPIDPDGILVGQPPFSAYCRFDENTGQVVTEVMHKSSENLINVNHCEDPGCYVKNLTYISGDDGKEISISQLEALIELSSDCAQSFYYECTLAPLRTENIDYAYWIGRNGDKNVYFTGSESEHACDCFYSEKGCEKQDLLNTACNCDSNEPAPLVDTGSITKSSALPILSVAFGGLTFEMQHASYKFGRLVCQGKKFDEIGTSCRSLKLAGETKSGYYTIKKENNLHTSTAYCDMSDGGYENVPEFKQLTSDAPLGTITAWIAKLTKEDRVGLDLPDGWLPCDGRAIENGLWLGGITPNLNVNGHFLRGGNENNAMEFEEDQMQDHVHTDPGHSHNSPPHSHSYLDEGSVSGSGFNYVTSNWHKTTPERTTSETEIKIDSSKSNIGGIATEYRSGTETRPRNMKVMWVMKCW